MTGVRDEDRAGRDDGAPGCAVSRRRVRTCHDPPVAVANRQRHSGCKTVAEQATQRLEELRKRPFIAERFLNGEYRRVPLALTTSPGSRLPDHHKSHALITPSSVT